VLYGGQYGNFGVFFPNLRFCEKFPSSRHKALVIVFFGALESQLRLDIARANQIQNRLADSKVILVVPRAMSSSFYVFLLLEKKYGDSKASKDDSGDIPTKPTGKKPLVVGNVCTDRTTILTEEFDLLFDMTSQPAADDDSEMTG
jgi:hypothetical protein